MNSPVISIGWELLARKRWATALVAFAFPLSYGLNLALPKLARSTNTPGWFMPFEFIAFLLAITTIFWMFSVAEPDRSGKQYGFPARLFVLPLRTFQLIGIPVMFGMASVVLYYFLWAALIFPQWGVTPLPGMLQNHLLTVGAMLITVQAVVWSFHAFPWIQRILVTVLLLVLGWVGIPESAAHRVSAEEISWFMVGTIVLAWFGALAGVARDRCGNWEGWTGKLLQRVRDSLPERRQAFASLRQAQFWIEWDRKGWFLSSFIFALPVAMSLMLFVFPMIIAADEPHSVFVLFGPVLLCFIMASTVGGGIAKFDFWSAKPGIGSFIATRPITTGEIVLAKLKVATVVAAVGLVIVIALAPLAFNAPRWLLAARFELEIPTWTDFKQWNPHAELLFNPVVCAAFFAVGWHSVIAGLSLSSLARPNKVMLLGGIGVFIFIAVMTMAAETLANAWFRSIAFPVLPWLAVALGIVKLAASYRAFSAVQRQMLFTPRQLLFVVGLWAFIAIAVVAGMQIFHAHAVMPDPLLLFLGAYFLPGPELPNCALHIANDRHR